MSSSLASPIARPPLEPVTAAFAARLDRPPPYELSVEQARAGLPALQAAASAQRPPALIEDRAIPGGPTGEVAIRIVRPLGLPTMRWFWDHYLPDVSRRVDPTASPLRASLDALHGLPPALVITAESDVLRDEGENYARRLADAGVDVTAVRYLGTIHAFVVLDALAGTPAARAAIAQAGSFLRDRLAVSATAAHARGGDA